MTSSNVPEYARDAPPQSSAAPVAPRSLRDFSGHDGNVPLGPRSMTHSNEELLSRNGPTGGAEYDRDRGRNNSRQPIHYPAPLPSSMNIDREEGRMDRYSRVSIFVGIPISWLFMNLNFNSLPVQIKFRSEKRSRHSIQMRDFRQEKSLTNEYVFSVKFSQMQLGNSVL
jgi:hypothetical protein